MTDSEISPVPREARIYQGRRAGVVTRGVASAIDGVVVALVVLTGYGALAGFLFLLRPRNFSMPDAYWLVGLTTAFVILVGYLSVSWWTSGRTYGCLVMGLRVVDGRGSTLRLPRAFLRAVLCASFPIGLAWCVVSRGSRSLQDLVVHTFVVYDWQPRGVSRRRQPSSAGPQSGPEDPRLLRGELLFRENALRLQLRE